MIQQLFAISRHTFVASIRQPILVALIWIAIGALALNPSLAAFTLEDDNKLLIDLGFSTLFLIGLLMAAFTATGVLGEEVENQTALTIVSKPVARPVFVLGKYFGVGAAIGVAYWILCGIFLLTIRHRVMQTAAHSFDGPVLLTGVLAVLFAFAGAILGNYLYRRPFISNFIVFLFVAITIAWFLTLLIDPQWQVQNPRSDLNPQVMIGLLLVFQAVLILTAVAVAASTRLGQMLTLMICVGAFLMGLLNDYLFGRFAATNSLSQACYVIMPNLQMFWPADALTQGHRFTLAYVGLVSGYTALYTIALLSMAVALFQKRELK